MAWTKAPSAESLRFAQGRNIGCEVLAGQHPFQPTSIYQRFKICTLCLSYRKKPRNLFFSPQKIQIRTTHNHDTQHAHICSREMQYSPEESNCIFKQMDKDGNGFVSEAEFMGAWKSTRVCAIEDTEVTVNPRTLSPKSSLSNIVDYYPKKQFLVTASSRTIHTYIQAPITTACYIHTYIHTWTTSCYIHTYIQAPILVTHIQGPFLWTTVIKIQMIHTYTYTYIHIHTGTTSCGRPSAKS
jgi:hypothetical protein